MATLLLPRGVSRNRYRREFAAELYGLSTAGQLAYAASVCGHMWSLRAVVIHGSDVTRIPFLCRTNIRHRWQSAADKVGPPVPTCSQCGRARPGMTEDNINALFLPIGAGETKR